MSSKISPCSACGGKYHTNVWDYDRNGSAYIVGLRNANGVIMNPVACFIEKKSNANIIAQSPSMLDMLKRVADCDNGGGLWTDEFVKLIPEIRVLIQRAEEE